MQGVGLNPTLGALVAIFNTLPMTLVSMTRILYTLCAVCILPCKYVMVNIIQLVDINLFHGEVISQAKSHIGRQA